MHDYSEFADLELAGWSDGATAKAYAEGFASASALHVPHLVRAVEAGPGSRALDLCCGHGIIAEQLVEAGAETTGLDFSPAMLRLARDRVGKANFVEGDAGDLPFEDDSFDAVTIGLGMPHVPDPAAVAREVHRVLRRGGRLAFTVWCGVERSLAWRAVFGSIATHGDPEVKMPPAPDANALSEKVATQALLQGAGFDNVDVEIIDSYWDIDDPSRLFEYFYEGTVRGGALLRQQPSDYSEAIRSAIADVVVSELGPDGPWRVPVPAAMTSATAV
jgi:SAM-dependent methyltransferase